MSEPTDDQLGLACDHMNTALDSASDLLARRYAVSAEVTIDNWVLGFGKLKDRWGLYVRSEHSEGRMPLTDTSRDRRVIACSQLDLLLRALDDNTEDQLAEVTGAAATAWAFVEKIK